MNKVVRSLLPIWTYAGKQSKHRWLPPENKGLIEHVGRRLIARRLRCVRGVRRYNGDVLTCCTSLLEFRGLLESFASVAFTRDLSCINCILDRVVQKSDHAKCGRNFILSDPVQHDF